MLILAHGDTLQSLLNRSPAGKCKGVIRIQKKISIRVEEIEENKLRPILAEIAKLGLPYLALTDAEEKGSKKGLMAADDVIDETWDLASTFQKAQP